LGPQKANDWMTGFDKGHLAANADFAFVSQQKATFYYLNCIPQFHNFNAINWIVVEKTARKLARENGNIIVVTGAAGNLIVDHTSIYLDAGNRMPVPWIFWKAIIINQKATYMFVGLNYPTNSDFSQSKDRINGFCDPCPNSIFRTINDPTKGIVMCCMYDTYARQQAMKTYGIDLPPFN
jgi:DNA/RNA endonuclease G (NUC1)